ncbi:MAG: O-antigen ligase family protein [Actinomycetota bacterium]|nr:O-antigen ligase family protein [Actinomycetota bacterium]
MTALALPARVPPPVGVAALLLATALLVATAPGLALAVAVAAFLAGIGATLGVTCTSTALVALYLVPLFAFGRSFSRIGIPPLQLPEAILITALAVSAPKWWPAYKTLVPTWFRVSTLSFAGLALVSVVRGAVAGYPAASRGFVLLLYPLVSGPFAAWIAVHRQRWDRILLAAVASAPFGLVLLSAVSSQSVVAAAYALYLSVLVGRAMTADRPWVRQLLVACSMIGVVALAATGRRGPLLAVAAACLVGLIALTGYRPPRLPKLVATSSFVMVSVLCVVVVGGVDASNLPGVGSVVERTRRGLTDPGSPEEANVAFRFAVWKYALTTVTSESPLLGMGFGRPFSLRFRERDLARDEFSAAHNSYVGVTYAAGFPAGLLFIGVFLGAASVCLRKPRSDRYRPVQLAWLASAALITLTNVAAETTYIGGPLWLFLGWLTLRQGAGDSPGPSDSTRPDLGRCTR